MILALSTWAAEEKKATPAKEEKAEKKAPGNATEEIKKLQEALKAEGQDPGPIDVIAAGQKTYVEVECYKCHEVKGETFPAVADADKGVGPELSQMAGMHPVEFFAESIIDPNAVIDPDAKERGYLGDDGRSKMPNFNDILTVKQVSDLAAYLASLKGKLPKGH